MPNFLKVNIGIYSKKIKMNDNFQNRNHPKYYIIKCKIHKGEIYSITKDDNICGGCAMKKKQQQEEKENEN